MEILTSEPAVAGDLVRVREAIWRVMDVRTFARVRLVRLIGADERNRWQPCTLIEPFDRLQRVAARDAPRVVSRARWMRTLAALIASAAPPPASVVCESTACDRPTGAGATPANSSDDGADRIDVWPATVAQAQVTLMPHQIAPLLAVLRGESSRLLLADAVGLGKTIQAALIVRELRARGLADRVLVLVPCGLRDQWRHELSHRAALASVIVDAATLAARARELPPDVNPWTLPGIHIVSVDFMKQPAVLRGADRLAWDILIVDEAHGLNDGTNRLAAVDVLARRSRHVLLLTATPHHGSDDAFATLCRIGQLDDDADRLAIFRRTRWAIGLPHRRRIHIWRVTPSREERWLHTLLRRYANRVEREDGAPGRDAAALATSVLLKRASSSSSSLERSLRRRLALLDAAAESDTAERDAAAHFAARLLPFEVEGDAVVGEANDADDADLDAMQMRALGTPGLRSRRLERAWLTLLIEAARNAARAESKPRALARWLARVRGEAALIYTEYRDTLTHLASTLPRDVTCAVLHGGLGADARRLALGRFLSGEARVLLTTDAAGEGLNLHHRCRLVFNVELPWNPNRLEQRIGRVDRLGQTRTVHAVHLVAADTAEEQMIDRLTGRIDRIESTIGDAPQVLPASAAPPTTPSSPSAVAEITTVVHHLHVARAAHARAWRSTAMTHRRATDPLLALEARAPLIAVARHGRRNLAAPGLLCVWRTRVLGADGRGQLPFLTVLHLACDPAALSRLTGRRGLLAFVSAVVDASRERIELLLDREGARVLRDRDAGEPRWRERLARRDAAIADGLRTDADAGLQPWLFPEIAAAQPRDVATQERYRGPHEAKGEPRAEPARVERTLALVLVVR